MFCYCFTSLQAAAKAKAEADARASVSFRGGWIRPRIAAGLLLLIPSRTDHSATVC